MLTERSLFRGEVGPLRTPFQNIRAGVPIHLRRIFPAVAHNFDQPPSQDSPGDRLTTESTSRKAGDHLRGCVLIDESANDFRLLRRPSSSPGGPNHASLFWRWDRTPIRSGTSHPSTQGPAVFGRPMWLRIAYPSTRRAENSCGFSNTAGQNFLQSPLRYRALWVALGALALALAFSRMPSVMKQNSPFSRTSTCTRTLSPEKYEIADGHTPWQVSWLVMI